MGTSAKPLQNINENVEEVEEDAATPTDKSDETEEDDEENKDNENATVHIDQDSSHISLSACNYDHSLINYLQSHPLTMDSACIEGNQPILDAIENVAATTPIEDPQTGQIRIQSNVVAQPQQQNGKRPPNSSSKEVLAVSFFAESFKNFTETVL